MFEPNQKSSILCFTHLLSHTNAACFFFNPLSVSLDHLVHTSQTLTMNRHGLAIYVEHKLRKTKLKLKELALNSEETSMTFVDGSLKK